MVRLLAEMGHPIASDETMGSAQSIMIGVAIFSAQPIPEGRER